MPPNQKYQSYAITLTTGRQPSMFNIKMSQQQLLSLISKYLSRYRYYFELELHDDNHLKTKIHYHGTVHYTRTNTKGINDFISYWKKNIGHIKVRQITDPITWDIYIKKQYTLHMSTYPLVPKYINNLTYKSVYSKYKEKDIKIVPITEYLESEA